MRNESESTSITRPEAMDGVAICAVLEDLTIQTEVRIWYWTKSKFLSEQFDEDESDDKEDFTPYRDSEEMTEAELFAIELNTCLYATVTEVDDYVEMDALGGGGSCSFYTDSEDGIHHIEVVKVGLPPAEEVAYHYGHDDLRADPARDYVDLAGQEVYIEGVRLLHAALGRWMEHRKQAA